MSFAATIRVTPRLVIFIRESFGCTLINKHIKTFPLYPSFYSKSREESNPISNSMSHTSRHQNPPGRPSMAVDWLKASTLHRKPWGVAPDILRGPDQLGVMSTLVQPHHGWKLTASQSPASFGSSGHKARDSVHITATKSKPSPTRSIHQPDFASR